MVSLGAGLDLGVVVEGRLEEGVRGEGEEGVEVMRGFPVLHVSHGPRVSPGLTPGDILWGGRDVPGGAVHVMTDSSVSLLSLQ